MAKRHLVNRVPVGTTCDKDIYEKIKAYSTKHDINISRITDKAYKMFLDLMDGGEDNE